MSGPSRRKLFQVIGIGAMICLLVIGFFAPRTAATGWLVAFATLDAVVFGAVALLLIHRLTGGPWGALAQPALLLAAALMPLTLIVFLLLLAGSDFVYPWISHPHSAGPGVSAWYLNIGFFAGRGLVFVVGLTLVASLLRDGRLGRLSAALGLVWYVVGMDFIAVDWLMSVEPHYASSAFGAQIIVDQLVAALAWAVLTTDAAARDDAWGDLAALLLATLLGETYLILMTFTVQWYGDLPPAAAWYVRRMQHGWVWLEVAGTLVGSFGPLLALLFWRVRHSARWLKLVSVAALTGVMIENMWLVVPGVGRWSAAVSLLAVVAIGALAVGFGENIAAVGRRRSPYGV